MPTAGATAPSMGAAAASLSPHLPDKDRVGEELADDARIWRLYDQIARTDDKERIDTWNRGLDNLALFAGLFSAVTTAFIIEAQKDMKLDYSQLTFQALSASLAGKPFTQEPFVVSSSSRMITCLWVTSLMLSLSAALIAIMGKDWIGMYAGRPVCNARQWAEMRTYRLLCVERWYMSQVIASAPVLLHVSLLLFGAGLVLFVPSDPITRHLTVGLALAAGALYLVTALSAIVFPASPFKSPATQMIRGALAALLRTAWDMFTYRPRRVSDSHAAINAIMAPNLIEVSQTQVRRLRINSFLDRLELLRVPPGRVALDILNGARAFSRSVPVLLRSAFTIFRAILHRAYKRIQPSTIASALREIHISHVFLGSSWTDVRPYEPYRSAARLSKALSWLITASQAPDVLRAITVALGDLEIGGDVAPLISSDLRDRITADIRLNWRKVDFLTLSRYVLADRNLSQDVSLLSYRQFLGRFGSQIENSLRCEDGLAAVTRIGLSYFDYRGYFPDTVAQPRMASLLIPHIAKHRNAASDIIVIVNLYKQILSEYFFSNLETELLRVLPPWVRQEYRSAVRDKYGHQYGTVELLVFLICNYDSMAIIRVADEAINIVQHIVVKFRRRRYFCLAYLFGDDSLPSRLINPEVCTVGRFNWLCSCLRWPDVVYGRRRNDELLSLSGDCRRMYELAIARTILRISAKQQENEMRGQSGVWRSSWERCSRYLHWLLCVRRGLLTDDDELDLIELLLDATALSWVRNWPISQWFGRVNSEHCLVILLRISGHLRRILGMADTSERGIRLFGLFVFSQVTTHSGSTVTWDLGDFLRKQSLLIRQEAHIAEAMRQLLSRLKEIHSVYHSDEHRALWNNALRAHWDRIGLPEAIDDWSFDTQDALAAFFAPRAPHGKDKQVRAEISAAHAVEHDAHWWLDASMR